MGFDEADYRRVSARLTVPVAHSMAMAAVESGGETFWVVDGRLVVPVRFEAHWFGKRSGYRFNESHPDLSCVSWNPDLAAKTRAGAWDQVNRARLLDSTAANEATSWGAFQVMGFNWQRLRYNSADAFVSSMSDRGDDGQIDAFAAFVEADPILHRALRVGDWDTVERLYNGGGYGGSYAVKLRNAVALYSGAGAPVKPRILRLNDHGADVAALQSALGLAATSIFDAATDSAVRLVQQHHHLEVDGKVGPMTRGALGM